MWLIPERFQSISDVIQLLFWNDRLKTFRYHHIIHLIAFLLPRQRQLSLSGSLLFSTLFKMFMFCKEYYTVETNKWIWVWVLGYWESFCRNCFYTYNISDDISQNYSQYRLSVCLQTKWPQRISHRVRKFQCKLLSITLFGHLPGKSVQMYIVFLITMIIMVCICDISFWFWCKIVSTHIIIIIIVNLVTFERF